MKRVCVLTGASGRLGTELLRRCSDRYQMVAVWHTRAPRFPTQEQLFVDPLDPERPIAENERPVTGLRADLSTDDGVESVVAQVLERFGGIDLLVNAAVHRRFSPLLAPGALDDAEPALRVNLLAPIRLAVGFATSFWRARIDENVDRRRNVVNVSSTAGVYVYDDLGQAMYSTAKAALHFATYHLASELWNIGVRVNAVAPNSFPGLVSTEEVIAQILAFDESDQTGQLVVIDR